MVKSVISWQVLQEYQTSIPPEENNIGPTKTVSKTCIKKRFHIAYMK